MGERDNHIGTCISLSPGGDYSRMAMVSRSLMERCSPEGRWWPMAATETAAAFGGTSPERRRQPGGGARWWLQPGDGVAARQWRRRHDDGWRRRWHLLEAAVAALE